MAWKVFNPLDGMPAPQKEIPTDITPDMMPRRMPENPWQAIMETAPGDTPEIDRETLQQLREAINQCQTLLTDEHQYVLDALYVERTTLRTLGHRLGVSHVHARRIGHKALDALTPILLMHPVVRERLKMSNYWEHAAFSALLDVMETPVEITFSHAEEEWLRNHIREAHLLLGQSASIPARQQATTRMRTLGSWAWGQSDQTAEGMVRLLCSKQRDYGHGNINAFGLYGVLVRMSDKVERYLNLRDKGVDPSNESLRDTFDDIVGYAVIATMLVNNSFNLPLESEEL